MSSEHNKQLIREYYEQVVNTGDTRRMAEFVSPDYSEVHDGTRHELGLQGAAEHIAGVRQTYPDLTLTIDHQIAEGQWVATCVTMRGTHAGAWMGIEPTGRPVQITAVNVDRIVDGRIVEHGGAANMLGPLMAVGAVCAGRPHEPR